MPSYRSATSADLDACWALRTRALQIGCAAHYPAEMLAALCASPPPPSMPGLLAAGAAIVAEEDGHPVGYAVLDGASGEVEAVFVAPEWQGRGIGLQLLARLEALAAGRKLPRLFLSASLNAVPVYERTGFARVRKELQLHRSGIALASVFMEKQLNRDSSGFNASELDSPPDRR